MSDPSKEETPANGPSMRHVRMRRVCSEESRPVKYSRKLYFNISSEESNDDSPKTVSGNTRSGKKRDVRVTRATRRKRNAESLDTEWLPGMELDRSRPRTISAAKEKIRNREKTPGRLAKLARTLEFGLPSTSTAKSTEEQRVTVVETSPEDTEQSPVVAEHSPEVAEQSPEVAEQSPELTEHSAEVTEQSPAVAENVSKYSPALTEHFPDVPEQSPEVTEHSPEVTEQSPAVPENTSEVAKYSPALTEHSPEIVEQSPTVAEHFSELAKNSPELLLTESYDVTGHLPELTEHSPDPLPLRADTDELQIPNSSGVTIRRKQPIRKRYSSLDTQWSPGEFAVEYQSSVMEPMEQIFEDDTSAKDEGSGILDDENKIE